MPISIFISHASKDRVLVDLFVKALEASMVIPEGGIRCTTLPGYRLRAGAHTSTALRAEIAEARILIGILTPESLESGWVMFELGAAWGASKPVLTVAVGIDYEFMPGPLKETNATDAASRAELEQLFDEISESLDFQKRRAGRQTEALDELVAEAETYLDDDEEDDEDDE
jgi:hypothetical protein